MSNESGQTLVEYVLLLAIVTGAYVLIASGLGRFGIMQKLSSPITESYKYAYRYGHPQARGPEDGGYKKHPRALAGGDNFRLFINPDRRR